MIKRDLSKLLFILLFLVSCTSERAGPTTAPVPIQANEVEGTVPQTAATAVTPVEITTLPPTRVETGVSATATSTVLPGATPISSATPRPQFHVTPEGSDERGTGGADRPWASIAHAVERVQDGATIVVAPGIYYGEVALNRRFEQGVVIAAAEPYLSRLEYDDTVVTCYTCAGVTLEGFEIAHDGEGADRYVIQIQDLEGEGEGGQRVTLRNNVIHDSRNNDLVKVNNGAGQILISGNIFYNMGGPHRDSHLDINSVTDVVVEGNIFFNDFPASNRDNDHDTGSFVVIKDSNEDDDRNLGSHRVTVRRNIFLNWQGDDGNTFVVVGEDAVDYFQATDVLVENNLMLGNATEEMMQSAFQIRGGKDITFRNNTVAGDLPAHSYAVRLARSDNNPRNVNITFYNNIWSDPGGTMGGDDGSTGLFADADPRDTESFALAHNLYWNGGKPIPIDEDALVNYTDDPDAIVADPLLGKQERISLPLWRRDRGEFADGSPTIAAAFVRLVEAYGTPAAGSAAVDAADPRHAAAEDILGRRRPVGDAPDIGAVERR